MQSLQMEADKYLGKGGVILGDSGVGDGGNVFLNPYHAPTSPERCWFNFCHSSTRFFVEQTFGVWKSRFRFLMHGMPETNHKLMTKLIYASAVLHNFLLVDHAPDGQVEVISGKIVHDPAWQKLFNDKMAHLCPTCKRDKKPHCIHQAPYRQGVAQMKIARQSPSDLRDALCAKLWAEVCADGDASEALRSMEFRAENGFNNDE